MKVVLAGGEEIEIEVVRASGVKCPRCWNYHTIQGNPANVCDRCITVVTGMLPELVKDGRWTQAAADEWLSMVKLSASQWRK